MRLDIYRRKDDGEVLEGSIRLVDGKAKFDPSVESIRNIGVPPDVTPDVGERYLRAVASVLRRGTLTFARLVPDED